MFEPPPKPTNVHPALILGIGFERTHYEFGTNKAVFAVSGLLIAAVIVWAIINPDGITDVGNAWLDWIIVHFGWMFGILTLTIFGFMVVLGYGPAGGVRLGADDEAPEFTTFSWVAMLFSAGMGIGLLFYGPYEPLTYFANPPSGFDVTAGTVEASQTALAQTALHWGAHCLVVLRHGWRRHCLQLVPPRAAAADVGHL